MNPREGNTIDTITILEIAIDDLDSLDFKYISNTVSEKLKNMVGELKAMSSGERGRSLERESFETYE